MQMRFGTAPWFSRSRAKGLCGLKAVLNQMSATQYGQSDEDLENLSACKMSRLPIMSSMVACENVD
jgi:hypothetical protein